MTEREADLESVIELKGAIEDFRFRNQTADKARSLLRLCEDELNRLDDEENKRGKEGHLERLAWRVTVVQVKTEALETLVEQLEKGKEDIGGAGRRLTDDMRRKGYPPPFGR